MRLILLTVLFAYFSANSQVDSSLSKYSYLLFGFDVSPQGVKPAGGTGFFIREANDLFFITARHVIVGCGDSLKKDIEHPKQMNIRLHDENGKMTSLYPLYVKSIQDTALCRHFRDYPDGIVFKIDKSKLVDTVFSAENFLSSPFKEPSTIQVFGYPQTEPSKYDIQTDLYKQSSLLFLEPGRFMVNNTYSENKMIDSINYTINTDISFNRKFYGYSGSPVFVQDSKTNKWSLYGVWVGGEQSKETYQAMVVLKMSSLLRVNFYETR